MSCHSFFCLLDPPPTTMTTTPWNPRSKSKQRSFYVTLESRARGEEGKGEKRRDLGGGRTGVSGDYEPWNDVFMDDAWMNEWMVGSSHPWRLNLKVYKVLWTKSNVDGWGGQGQRKLYLHGWMREWIDGWKDGRMDSSHPWCHNLMVCKVHWLNVNGWRMDGCFSHPLKHNLIVYTFGEHLKESLWMDGMFTKMCFNSP